MEYKLTIIIPTYNSNAMTERVLDALTNTTLPASLNDIVIVENGPKLDAEMICQRYQDKLPLKYIYTKKGNLSHARNLGINNATGDVLIFFDNDMKFDQNTLLEYDKYIQIYGDKCFYGGPVLADYEERPPEWLRRHLPWSAKGHSLGDKVISIETALFLGGNHVIPRNLFNRLNGYDEMCAAGNEGMIGEETRLQEKLLAAGHQGIYVPGAVVHHWIPKEKCDETWALHRNYRAGLTQGEIIKQSLPESACMLFGIPCYIAKEYLALQLKRASSLLLPLSSETKFEIKNKSSYLKGVIKRFKQTSD